MKILSRPDDFLLLLHLSSVCARLHLILFFSVTLPFLSFSPRLHSVSIFLLPLSFPMALRGKGELKREH